jgi:hypothetical protein
MRLCFTADKPMEASSRPGKLPRYWSATLACFTGAGVIYALWIVGAPLWESSPPRTEDPKFSAMPPRPVRSPVTSSPVLTHIPGSDSSVSPSAQMLHLVHTTLGRNAREGLAQLGVDPRHPQTFRTGALLENGSTLFEVYGDHVVLTNGTRRAVLYTQTTGSHAPEGDVALYTVGRQSAAASVAAPTATQRPPVTPATYLKAAPAYDGDQLVGLRVYPGPQGESFRAWGLEPDDVISAVDGVSVALAGPSSIWLQRVIDGAAVTVSVTRNGQPLTRTLDGAAIARSASDSTSVPGRSMP